PPSSYLLPTRTGGRSHRCARVEEKLRQGAPRQPESLRGLHVDDQLKFGRLHNRQIPRWGALEDSAGIDAKLAIRLVDTGSIADQAAVSSEAFPGSDGEHRVASRERDDFRRVHDIQGVDLDAHCGNVSLRE